MTDVKDFGERLFESLEKVMVGKRSALELVVIDLLCQGHVLIEDVPYIDANKRCEVHELGDGFYRTVLHYGFMEETDVPEGLKQMERCGGAFEMMNTSFFLSRQTLIPSERPGMPIWREKLFAWMLRNAATAMEFFRLPTNRVVELGSQLEI